jgi:oxamate amidohydrolase
MDRYTAGHRRGVVCAPHFAAAEAGRAVLAEGGNAIEAMVAMAAMIAVVYPHMNHLGGDGFWVVHEPSGKVRALMAAGAAGARATLAHYRDAGHDRVPTRGPLAALTVPGAVAGWMLALQAAKAQGGRLPVAELLAPAIKQAREGVEVSRHLAINIADASRELKDVPGFAETFLIDGKPPLQGARLHPSALAETLDHLAHAGLDDFYRGDIAREIAADLDRVGSPVTRADLERCRAVEAAPLSVALPVGTLWNTAPPTPGLMALMILAIYDRLGVKEAESFDHLHGLIEAAKRAIAVRDRVLTDPARLPHPLDRYLTPAFLDAEAAAIDRRRAAPWKAHEEVGDTIWMGAADASGLVVSYIQSLYWEFGSGVVLPQTGIVMQNRGMSFSLDRSALNVLEPGRLPLHTLCAALAVLRDGRVMAYGSMGGDAQPQVQGAVFSRHGLHRQPLERAIAGPRWYVGKTWGKAIGSLVVEARLDGNLIEQLMSAGHDVVLTDAIGHAGAVVLHPDGSMEGAHDPRADGGAAGV